MFTKMKRSFSVFVLLLFLQTSLVSSAIPATKVVTICLGNSIKIACTASMHQVNIVDGFYGRKDTKICPDAKKKNGQNTKCESKNARSEIFNKCYGTIQCILTNPMSSLGDPCPDTTKYMQVKYFCEKYSVF